MTFIHLASYFFTLYIFFTIMYTYTLCEIHINCKALTENFKSCYAFEWIVHPSNYFHHLLTNMSLQNCNMDF